MNDKIPLNALAAQMAKMSGLSEADCQSFVKVLFHNIADDLIQGKVVDVKGIGRFSVDTTYSDPIRFTPDSELASEINAPFNFFQPVEMTSDVDLDTVDEEISQKTIVESAEKETAPVDEISLDVPSIPIEEPSLVEETLVDTEVEESVPESPVEETPSNDCDSQTEELTENISGELTPPIPEVESIVDETIDDSSMISINTIAEPEEDVEPVQTEIVESDVIETVEPAVSMIPEEEEEYVEYYQTKRKGQFWIGFFVGLMVGLILAAIAYAAYTTNIINLPF